MYTGPRLCIPDVDYVYRTWIMYTGPELCIPDLKMFTHVFSQRNNVSLRMRYL